MTKVCRDNRSSPRLRFLVTAGGTRESIDPVRFISNASSGKMGIALARAALVAGHEVTLIAAPSSLRPPAKATVVSVTSAREMFLAVKAHLCQCDCLIMAAAVSDYTVARPSRTKIKKTGERFVLELKPTVDILAWAGRHRNLESHKIEINNGNRFIVGFALEDRDIRRRAREKLVNKRLDMIVANTPAAIGADRSALQIKTAAGPWITVASASKAVHARRIIRMIEGLCRRPEYHVL